MFPHRDDVVEHLDRHAHEDGIELRLGTEVHRINRRTRGWRLETSTGEIDARQVVIANGNEHTPRIPEWPGTKDSSVEMLHSSDYRNPAPYAGKRVLVVGSGSSGMEIAHDLATGGAAKVWLAVRTPPHILLRSLPGGLPGGRRFETHRADLERCNSRIEELGDDMERRSAIGANPVLARLRGATGGREVNSAGGCARSATATSSFAARSTSCTAARVRCWKPGPPTPSAA